MAKKIMMVHALNEFSVLEDRIRKNIVRLTPHEFEKQEKNSNHDSCRNKKQESEKKEKGVMSVIQSSADLVKRYLWLKRCIAFSNAVYTVMINGENFSLTELVELKKNMSETVQRIYGAVNESAANRTAQTMRKWLFMCKRSCSEYGNIQYNTEKKRYYDADEVAALIRQWNDLNNRIVPALQEFNANHELLDPEKFKI